jgi:exonuclease III
VNINGISNKKEELEGLSRDLKIDIITVQETKLSQKSRTPKIADFTAIRTDRSHKVRRRTPYLC